VFRIEVFVDDKKLAAFLNAAAGLVASMSPPLPVVNLASNHAGLKASGKDNMPDIFYSELKKKKKAQFTAQDAKEFLEKTGKSPASYNYMIGYLKEQKLVKMISPGNYKVIK
jgi:hypothetical protein